LSRTNTAYTSIVEFVDNEVQEDLAGRKGAVNIFNEAVIPGNGFAPVGGDALGTHDRWASWIPESLAPILQKFFFNAIQIMV
jgi:hypothetical protein